MAASRSTSRSGSLTSKTAALALALAACSAGLEPRPQARGADLVFLGGEIHTMDEQKPRVEALAVAGRRIVAVGDASDVRPLIGPKTRVIELGDRALTPGLVDSHAHLYGLGKALGEVSLRGVKSPEAAAKKAAEAAEALAEDEWVTGRGWDQNLWEVKEFPTREILDAAVAERPASLRRIDGHALWANSAALELAGVTAETKSPEGGEIVRDDAGEPTGVFIDAAMSLIESKIPTPTAEVREQRILRAAEKAIASGLTCVHEMGISKETARVYQGLADEGRLPLRVYGFLSGDAEVVETLPERIIEVDRDGTAHFIVRGIKLFADGALGSRGAALLEPYADEPENRGNWLMKPEALERAAKIAAESGWQLAVHAIGDAANRAVLDAYAAALAAHPDEDLRFRVEHAQVVAPGDLARFGELDVIASMQPTHATSDMPWAAERLGPERVKGAYAWKSILDRGGRLAAGSDFPVEEVSPLLGLYAAVTRQGLEGEPSGGWHPEQRLSLQQALRAFTAEAAYASFVEESRGRLRPGFVADITVYDRSLEAGASLLETKIDMTIVGGRVVYQRE